MATATYIEAVWTKSRKHDNGWIVDVGTIELPPADEFESLGRRADESEVVEMVLATLDWFGIEYDPDTVEVIVKTML